MTVGPLSLWFSAPKAVAEALMPKVVSMSADLYADVFLIESEYADSGKVPGYA